MSDHVSDSETVSSSASASAAQSESEDGTDSITPKPHSNVCLDNPTDDDQDNLLIHSQPTSSNYSSENDISKTILCKVCRVSWHIKFHIPKITNYYRNNKTNWACSGCKQSKQKSTQVIQDTQEPLITTTITVNTDDTTSKKSTLSSSSSSITITRSNKNKKHSLFKNDGKNK